MFFQEMKQHLRLGQCPFRDFAEQIAHVTTCCIFYTFLAYFRRVNAYQPLGILFEGIVAEWVENYLAQRLWAWFEDLLQVVLVSIAESGAVHRAQFQRSPEYATLKWLLAESSLGDQWKTFNQSA
ncbi:MAG: hypothetical protein M1415_09045 [Firmicutes bacterium]|nr:hypothetical protein [Bacillota bacterium]